MCPFSVLYWSLELSPLSETAVTSISLKQRNESITQVLVNIKGQKIVSRTRQILIKIFEESYLQNKSGFSIIQMLFYFTQIKITATSITKITQARNIIIKVKLRSHWYKSKIDIP